MSEPTDEQPRRYAVRYYQRATRDIDQITVSYADATGNEARAASLRNGIRDVASSLSENPEGNAVAEVESAAFGFAVRRARYRMSKGGQISYHLLYYVVEQSADGDVVFIMHVRHANRAPLTPDEASEIKVQQ